MILITGSGFLVFPYLGDYMTANVGVKETDFPLIYLCGGFCTIFSVVLIGRWADRAGKPYVFSIVSWLAITSVLALTNLPRVPVAVALAITTFFMICISGRGAPAMALVTGSIEARYRGSFMSLNSSLQQFTSGGVAYLGGLIHWKINHGRNDTLPSGRRRRHRLRPPQHLSGAVHQDSHRRNPGREREVPCPVRGQLCHQTKMGKRLRQVKFM